MWWPEAERRPAGQRHSVASATAGLLVNRAARCGSKSRARSRDHEETTVTIRRGAPGPGLTADGEARGTARR